MTLTLPRPSYIVDPPTTHRGGHQYIVRTNPPMILKGITTFLSVIGGDKSNRLIGWSKREALESARKAFYESWDNEAVEDWHGFVDGVIAKASKRPKELSDKALDVGSRLHDYIEKWIKNCAIGGALPIPDEDIAPLFKNFLDWQTTQNIQWIDAEVPCASIKHGYGTKVDAIGYRDGKLCIWEHKTSSGIFPEYQLQVAAESTALEETYNLKVDECYLSRFGKDGTTEIQKIGNREKCFEGFLASKKLYEVLEILND